MNKGQIDYPIITFIIVVFGILLIAPVILKTFSEIQSKTSTALGNVTGGAGQVGQQNFNTVMNTAINFWDKVLVAAFMVSIILLLISAFLIDTNPFWVILYLFISFMVIIFTPNIIASLDTLYNAQFVGSSSLFLKLTFMDAIRIHFGEFLVGIMVITGLIIYGKIALFGNRSRI